MQGADLSGLENEAGGHRIQRVPPTERKGRVHTSTVTVAIVDGTSEIKAEPIPDNQLKIEWYSGTGAGGQHRNKHQNSCRMTHIPTGIVVTSQCRSRENSLNEARTTLTQRVNMLTQSKHSSTMAIDRRQQVGSGMRGDKIRTYRFQDDRVQDHRTDKVCSLKKVMAGAFDLFW